jgi:serine/threonine protein kinase
VAFSQGRVSPAELANIQAHLDGCPACLAVLGQTTDDPFLARLRYAALRLPSDGPVERTTPTDRAPGDNGEATETLPTLPGYEVLGELGRGGMGVVYKARHIGLNRVCALKMILHAGHAGEDALQRFRTEAQAIARLGHPNIVEVYDLGTHDGLPFFSLEFCAGGSLDRKLVGTPIDQQCAAGRAYGHAPGALHAKDHRLRPCQEPG